MMAELSYALASVIYGMAVAACYHPLVFLRTFFYHGRAWVDAEDILFLMGAGVSFFLVTYEKNDGILRWYAFAGAFIGVRLYLRTAAVPLECARKWILQKIRKPYKIRMQAARKGRGSLDEGSGPEYKNKKKKKERS